MQLGAFGRPAAHDSFPFQWPLARLWIAGMRETASTKLLILIATREREERDSHHLVVIEGPLAILNKDMSQNMKGRRRYNRAYSAG